MIAGLYGIADVSGAPDRTELEIADALLDAGVTVLQLRMKHAPADRIYAVLHELVPRAREAGCALVVNDNLEVAVQFDGLGVHLGQADADPRDARRRLGAGPLIGWSTHSLDDVRRAARLPVDYIGFGPVFSSAGKYLSPEDRRAPMDAVGLDALSAVVAEATVPVVAIGGIRRDRLVPVMETGVAAAAVISAVSSARDPRVAARELARTARRYIAPKGSMR